MYGITLLCTSSTLWPMLSLQHEHSLLLQGIPILLRTLSSFKFKDPGDTVHVHSDSASMRELAYIVEWLG